MYRIPKGVVETEYIVKKSRFISRVGYVEHKERAKAFLTQCREDYPDAGHHCWAYLLGDPACSSSAAMSDDGEPSGTAGKPILNVLQHQKVGDIMIVVTRYFGGIKLGAGGLVRAYSAAAKQAVDQLETIEHILFDQFEVMLDFAGEKQLRHWLSSHQGRLEKINYSEKVRCQIAIPADSAKLFKEYSTANGWQFRGC